MTWTDQQINALLASVGRIAVAYEEMLAIQKKKAVAPSSTSSSSEKRERGPKGDVLTVIGHVLNFGIARGRGDIPLLTKANKEYWRVKLDNGFEASVFRDTQAVICSKAFEEGISLIVSYVISGEYKNIEGVALGTTPAGQQSKPRADYDDSAADSDPF